MKPKFNQSEVDQAEQMRQANSDALMRLCAGWNIQLPTPTAHLWRPCRPSRGDIPGVTEGLTILCTDGVVAWFKNDLDTLLYGHIQHFDGKVQPMHGVEKLRKSDGKARSRKPRVKPLSDLDKANALIAELLAKLESTARSDEDMSSFPLDKTTIQSNA